MPPHLVVKTKKIANRMRSTHNPSGLQFFFDNRTGWRQVYNLHIRWHPPFQCIWLTIYEPDVWLSGSQISKKWELNGFVRVPYQKLKKSTKIKNLTSPSFLVADKHYTMVEKSSLPFNHLQNIQKWHYRSRISEKMGRLLHWFDGVGGKEERWS